ncbi:hypothetical protein F5Y17DRAFT_458279 [Xylariaceae sp. FL0594]|nr:hypothetical protein F5Y17DRAFT_458279 [Xylariaceae sp. FL0594]
MIRIYLQTFRIRPFLQQSARTAARKDAPEIWSLRPAFSFSSQATISSLRRTARPKLPCSSSSSSSKRSFHRSSRLRNSERERPEPHTGKTRNESGSQSQSGSPLSFSARLKKLSREYGWSAVGVYFALSVLDFPFCFLLVRVVGTDRIGAFEHFVISNAKKVIPQSVRDKYNEYRASWKGDQQQQQQEKEEGSTTVDGSGWGVEEAEERNKSEASLGTQLALAYAIHKSFIFLRVPLTAAVTPKVVKVLRSWGWDIGKRRAKRGVSP